MAFKGVRFLLFSLIIVLISSGCCCFRGAGINPSFFRGEGAAGGVFSGVFIPDFGF